jgi:hemolysin activation/secretion protein
MITFMPTPLRLCFFVVAALAGGLVAALAQEQPAAAPAATPVYPFVRLVIADTAEKVAVLQATPDTGPVLVQDVPLLATKEFTDTVAAYVGRPITFDLINQLGRDIRAYLKKHDVLVAGILPLDNQKVISGEIRLIVTMGHYKQLQIQGNRWFSRDLLQTRLGVKPGDEVRLSTLEEAVNWANANPFRRVKVLVNEVQTEPGMADLIVNVQEALPLRLATSFDNSGNEVIGQSHYTASVQFGNLWGLDHQGSYQFTTTDDIRLYQAHSGDYRIPLPWHHYVQFSGAYSKSQPTFGGANNNDFSLTGESVLADLRYIAPIERAPFSLEFSAGLDFKRTNNNLEYGGEQVRATNNDIFQLNLGATVVRRDHAGAWVFGANVSLSPGNVNSRNSDDAFAIARPNGYNLLFDANGNPVQWVAVGQSRYIYGTFVVQRLTTLPAGFQLISRGQLQLASANLINTEQLTLGGEGTVRGYSPNVTSGDEGFLFSQELQGPEWQTPLAVYGRKIPPLQTRLVAFWDYGTTWYKHPFASDLAPRPLMGAGLGLRCNVATNFSLLADYGYQLITTIPAQPNHHCASIKVTLSY